MKMYHCCCWSIWQKLHVGGSLKLSEQPLPWLLAPFVPKRQNIYLFIFIYWKNRVPYTKLRNKCCKGWPWNTSRSILPSLLSLPNPSTRTCLLACSHRKCVRCSFGEKKQKGGRRTNLKRVKKKFKTSMEETEKTLQHTQATAHTVTRKVEELEMESPLTYLLNRTRNFNLPRKSEETSNAQFARISSLRLWRHCVNIISVGTVLNRP